MTNLAAAVDALKTINDFGNFEKGSHKEFVFGQLCINWVKENGETILAELGSGAGGDDMLPDALIPVSKEWYVLCERRFAVDKITISGDLARAIVDAMCNKPSPIETPTYQYVPTQRVGQSTEEYEKSVIDEANRILATRPPVAGLAEWLPIADAPKDGSWISAKRMGKRPFAVRYVNDCWQDENNLLRDPTHFYPLPEPKAAREFLGKVDG